MLLFGLQNDLRTDNPLYFPEKKKLFRVFNQFLYINVFIVNY